MADDLLREILEALNALMAVGDVRFDAQHARFDALEQRFDAQHARLDSLEARFDAAEARNAERHAELMGHMRRVEAKVDRLDVRVDRLHDDLVDLRARLSAVEHSVNHWGGLVASQSGRIDRFQAQIELIEKRLDLRDGPPN